MRLIRKMIQIARSFKHWIYRNNVFGLCSTFGYYKGGGTNVAITKNSDHMLLTITSAYGWAYSLEQIDLTDYKTLYFYGYHTGASTMRFDVRANYISTTAASDFVNINGGGTPSLVSLDVSALNGSYYVRFGNTIDANATDTIYCYGIYLMK